MIKSLTLSPKSREKLGVLPTSLGESDVEESLKGFTPGEWCFFKDKERKRLFLGFVNPIAAKGTRPVHVLELLKSKPGESVATEYIEGRIRQALNYRSHFKGYADSSRLVYGASDGLPGLVVDSYVNCVIIQLNTAGMDRHREFIKELISKQCQKPAFISDNQNLRAREMLPSYREELSLSSIEVRENDLTYRVPVRLMQKVGWYYDHRENRRRLEQFLLRWNKPLTAGVDLFSYQGAWGLHLLRAGVPQVDFVDQGDMADVVQNNIAENGLKNLGDFYRADVFKWLEQKIENGTKYDIIVSDPPAFAKSKAEKEAAEEGYLKLHRRVLKITAPEALVVFASCTHYVSSEEFFQTITRAAAQEKRSIRVLDTGLQSWDHPIESLESKSQYIKYFLVFVE